MKVYCHTSKVGSNKIRYLHIFSGLINIDQPNYYEVEKSYVKFGRVGGLFQGTGEEIYIGKNPNTYELSEVPQALIAMIFEYDFDLDSADFREINL